MRLFQKVFVEADEVKAEVKARSSSRHMWLMVLCCLAPIIAILALKAAGVQSPILSYAVVLICPLSMVLMMVMMAASRRK